MKEKLDQVENTKNFAKNATASQLIPQLQTSNKGIKHQNGEAGRFLGAK